MYFPLVCINTFIVTSKLATHMVLQYVSYHYFSLVS